MRVEVEKKGGKEDGSPTMPLMLFSFYRVIQSWRKGRDFFARLEYKQDGITETPPMLRSLFCALFEFTRKFDQRRWEAASCFVAFFL